jgi:hypothetical protein
VTLSTMLYVIIFNSFTNDTFYIIMYQFKKKNISFGDVSKQGPDVRGSS